MIDVIKSTNSWRPFKLNEIFYLKKGKRLTKANMRHGTTPFIGSIDSNNGVSGYIGQQAIHDGGTITVSYNGSVAEAFYQDIPFWATDDVNVLYPKFNMTIEIGLFLCTLLRLEKYRFNYGRKWHLNRMKESTIFLPVCKNGTPDWELMKNYISSLGIAYNYISNKEASSPKKTVNLHTNIWKRFEYQELFEIERGRGPRLKNIREYGKIPFITSIEKNNGLSDLTNTAPTHPGNSISVNRNGSVGEAFYQPVPFCSTEDVHIFKPKKSWAHRMNLFVGLFLVTLIRKEKYRFNYGRKWGIERMKKSVIKLPITSSGEPDWEFMENYIKSLPFGNSI